MSFESPWAFFFIIPFILIFTLSLFIGKRKQGLIFSSIALLKLKERSFRQRLLWLPSLLFFIGGLFIITALARPRERLNEIRQVTSGVAIELVIDRSGSMAAEIKNNGKFVRRMDIVKQNLLAFISGDGKNLGGRPDDLLGLVAFARYADTLSPLSLSHDVLKGFTNGLDVVTERDEDGTSIGDAVALAAARLKSAGENNDSGKGYEIKSKIIVLLTDGENNSGRYSPREAAEIAAKWGIKIYSIGFGGTAFYEVSGLFGTQRRPIGNAVDSETLKALAEITGGEYFEANSADELATVYQKIDELEKAEIVSFTEYKYKELFAKYLIAGLFLLVAAFILDSTILRRIP